MSHIAKGNVELKDQKCLENAAKKLGHKVEQVKNFVFYDGTKKSGTAVYLPGWRYPVVVDENGEAWYDNYRGSWGDEAHLNEVKQHYGVEVVKKEARLKGYQCREVKGVDGKVKVVVTA